VVGYPLPSFEAQVRINTLTLFSDLGELCPQMNGEIVGNCMETTSIPGFPCQPKDLENIARNIEVCHEIMEGLKNQQQRERKHE